MCKPVNICWHKRSRTLELTYASANYELTAEYLRVHSPSAEIRGHGKGDYKILAGKQFVNIKNILPAGNYALKIVFDDGHDSGIYTWQYLIDLCQNRDQYWQDYLQTLADSGRSRNNGIITQS